MAGDDPRAKGSSAAEDASAEADAVGAGTATPVTVESAAVAVEETPPVIIEPALVSDPVPTAGTGEEADETTDETTDETEGLDADAAADDHTADDDTADDHTADDHTADDDTADEETSAEDGETAGEDGETAGDAAPSAESRPAAEDEGRSAEDARAEPGQPEQDVAEGDVAESDGPLDRVEHDQTEPERVEPGHLDGNVTPPAGRPLPDVAAVAAASTPDTTPDTATDWAAGLETRTVPLPARGSDLADEQTAARRRRRQTWTFLAMFGLVLVIGAAGYTSWTGMWTIPGIPTHTPAVPCPTVTPTAAAANDVTVNVLNGTGRRGLAQSVSREMRARGFRVGTIGNDTSVRSGTLTAVVRYGPAGLLTARTVAAQVHGRVALVNDQRQSAIVDLILRPPFRALNSPKVANRMLAPPPVPSPQGCLPAVG